MTAQVYLFPIRSYGKLTPAAEAEVKYHENLLVAVDRHLPIVVQALSRLVVDLSALGAIQPNSQRTLLEVMLETIRDELSPEARKLLDERGWPR